MKRNGAQGHLAASAASIALVVAILWSAGLARAADKLLPNLPVQSLPRLTEGKAVVERLGPVYVDGAGSMVTARAGDWRLSNGLVCFTFASLDDVLTTWSMPVGGLQPFVRETDRVPGALIDVSAQSACHDFLASFTQGIGLEKSDAVMRYDTVEPLTRKGEVGLRWEGSPFETSRMRLETTYWLADGSQRLRIETRLLDRDPQEPIPPVCDAGLWGLGSLMTERGGRERLDEKSGIRPEFYAVNGGDLSIAVAPVEGKWHGQFIPRDRWSRVALTPETGDRPTTSSATAKDSSTSPTAPVTLASRDLWLIQGHDCQAISQMLTDRKVPTSNVTVKVLTEVSKKPVAGVEVEILRHDMQQKKSFLYTLGRTGEDGQVSLKLPGGWFIYRAPIETKGGFRTAAVPEVKPGIPSAIGLDVPERTGVRLRAVDAVTSKPLAARVRLEADSQNAEVDFGYPSRAASYMDTVNLPPEGRVVYLPAGYYTAHGTHGIRYGIGEADVVTSGGAIVDCQIPIHEDNPTTGWVGIEVGARTTATPGCSITPEDLALMAAAEGVEWVVTGDFEKITDLSPAIEKMKLKGRLQSMRGFRTLLPSHPEWGHFLIFPVAAAAPDPLKVKRQWADLTEAKPFIATLRRLYPDALIQVELPYGPKGEGYYAQGEPNPYEASWNPRPGVDTSVDALNMFPPSRPQDPKLACGFFYNCRVRGRNHIASTAPSSRDVYGGLPGYPRLLVQTGGKAEDVTQAKLMEALRKQRTMVSNGPFIDALIGSYEANDLIPYSKVDELKTAVYAPSWVELTSFWITKEDQSLKAEMLSNSRNIIRRYPPSTDDKPYSLLSQKDLQLNKAKDTLLGFWAVGTQPMTKVLPRVNPAFPPYAICFRAPFVIDRNENGKYDPLTLYPDKGK